MNLSQYFRVVELQARMQLRVDASRYLLGYIWWLLEPLAWVVMFYVVFNVILDSPRSGSEFLVFLSTGKLAFIWLSKTVVQASVSIVSAQSLISQINVPKTLFPLADVHESLYRQATVYLLMLVIVLGFGYPLSAVWFWLVPTLLVFYLMIVASAFVAAYLVCLMRDFIKVIPLVMTFLLFTSGIFWDPRSINDEQKLQLFLAINPVAFILDAHRQILMHQAPPDVLHLLLVGLVCGAMVAFMVWLMRRNSQYLALKVLT